MTLGDGLDRRSAVAAVGRKLGQAGGDIDPGEGADRIPDGEEISARLFRRLCHGHHVVGRGCELDPHRKGDRLFQGRDLAIAHLRVIAHLEAHPIRTGRHRAGDVDLEHGRFPRILDDPGVPARILGLRVGDDAGDDDVAPFGGFVQFPVQPVFQGQRGIKLDVHHTDAVLPHLDELHTAGTRVLRPLGRGRKAFRDDRSGSSLPAQVRPFPIPARRCRSQDYEGCATSRRQIQLSTYPLTLLTL